MRRPDLSVGDGIYRSTDAGNTWTHLGLRDAQQIGSVLVDPRDEKRVFVPAKADETLVAKVKDLAWDKIAAAMAQREKHARYEELGAVAKMVTDTLCAEGAAYAASIPTGSTFISCIGVATCHWPRR